jgi:hypothetical protein
MKTRYTIVWFVSCLVCALAGPAAAQTKGPLLKKLEVGGLYTLSGPYTEANLSIYLVHGRETIAGKSFLTLAEALEKKVVVVHETQMQNQLLVENVSADVEVFLQAGDIVKGGQQDRVIGCDLVISAKSRWTIPAFCVEQGRWQQRGSESAVRFESAGYLVIGKTLKLAIGSAQDQKLVWQAIAEAQKKLEVKLGQSVQSRQSPTSLQLTLEVKGLEERTGRYLKGLATAVDEHKDAVGCIVCINGQIVSADLYGSCELFRKMWPRLLRAAAVEAVADFEAGKEFQPVPRLAARAFLAEARLANFAQAQLREMAKRLQLASLDTPKHFLIETRDQTANGAMVHLSVVVK